MGEVDSGSKMDPVAGKVFWDEYLGCIAGNKGSYEHIGSHNLDLEVEYSPAHRAVVAAGVDKDLLAFEVYSELDMGLDIHSCQGAVAVAALDFAGSEVAEVLCNLLLE